MYIYIIYMYIYIYIYTYSYIHVYILLKNKKRIYMCRLNDTTRHKCPNIGHLPHASKTEAKVTTIGCWRLSPRLWLWFY